MNAKEYFEFYSTIVEVFQKEKPTDMSDLFSHLHDSEFVLSHLKTGTPSKELSDFTLEIIDNLLDDGLIKGTKIVTKSGSIYSFDGLTTEGHEYLLTSENRTNDFLAYIKENGLPLDPTSASKAIINFGHFLFRKKLQ